MRVSRIVLGAGFACGLALVAVAAVMFVEARQGTRAIAPAARTAAEVVPRTHTERRRGLLTPRIPARYEYAPSAGIVRASGDHRTAGLAWRSLLPSGDAPAPVVVLLHGAGRDGLSMLDMWQRVGRTQSLVLIAPEARGKTWAADDLTATRVAAMLDAVAATRAIDRDAVFLFGHSDGARHAAFLANRGIGPWRAVALHGGYGPPSEYRANPGAPPLRLYLGERDHIFSVAGARASATALASAGHETELHLIPGHTHWFYEIGPELAADAWRWFAGMAGPP
jgi:predicted esterase